MTDTAKFDGIPLLKRALGSDEMTTAKNEHGLTLEQAMIVGLKGEWKTVGRTEFFVVSALDRGNNGDLPDLTDEQEEDVFFNALCELAADSVDETASLKVKLRDDGDCTVDGTYSGEETYGLAAVLARALLQCLTEDSGDCTDDDSPEFLRHMQPAGAA